MKKLSFLLTVIIFSATVFAQKNVAVLEIERRASVADEISRDEAMEVTNVIRGVAVRNLPRGKYSVMTSETVSAMGDAVLAECADQTCVVSLGRTIDADYIVRGTLSKFQTRFTLNIEMFETEYGNLVATAVPVRSENLNDILDKSPAACAEMFRTFLNSSTPTTPQTTVSAPPPPPPPPTYSLTIRNNPAAGGTVTRNPDLPRYDAGARVSALAVPSEGYRFTGWSGASLPQSDSVTITMNRDFTLTANFRELPTPKPPRQPRPPKPEPAARAPRQDKGSPLKLTLQISSGALAVGGFVGGIVYNGMVDSEYDKFVKAPPNSPEESEARKNTEDRMATRDLLYILGGIGLSGFAVTLFF